MWHSSVNDGGLSVILDKSRRGFVMELRQLEYFLAVSELKSFTRAAEKMFVSQHTITNAINGLEKELNVKLLMRSNRQFALTT